MADALVVGATGQDGALLCHELLANGRSVVGTARRMSSEALWRLSHLGIDDEITFFPYSVGNGAALENIIRKVRPEQIFFSLGNSSTRASRSIMAETFATNFHGVVEQYEALVSSGYSGSAVFFGSSEVYGYSKVPGAVADEQTKHSPSNVYGLSKSMASSFLNYMREKESSSLRLYEVTLFPHESELRNAEFVVQKIVVTLSRYVKNGPAENPPVFGDLSSSRDWGSARSYMRRLVELAASDHASANFVLGSGTSYTVADVFRIVADKLGVSIDFRQADGKEELVDTDSGSLIAFAKSRVLENTGHGYVANSVKIKKALSLREDSPFEKVLDEMLAHQFQP